jgi:hypothetical protein
MKTPPQHDRSAPAACNASGRTRRTLILSLWAVLICCVVVGELLPAASPVMVAIGRLHIWDKLQHFGAYLALSFLPVIGFRNRRRGILAGLSMFVLGVLLEAGQHFSPGRAVELGDVLANGAGVSCGALLGLPFRTLIAILSKPRAIPSCAPRLTNNLERTL